jgi:hypothetical protein
MANGSCIEPPLSMAGDDPIRAAPHVPSHELRRPFRLISKPGRPHPRCGPSISDRSLFRPLARNLSPGVFRLLQQNRR